MLNLFYSDYDLNAVCHETCIEEALECIMSCDSTDSTCISDCLRAEDTCVTSKNVDIKIIKQRLKWASVMLIKLCILKFHWGCPCNIECPNGCDGCANSICECSVRLLSILLANWILSPNTSQLYFRMSPKMPTGTNASMSMECL